MGFEPEVAVEHLDDALTTTFPNVELFEQILVPDAPHSQLFLFKIENDDLRCFLLDLHRTS